jgi:hypothetical protein
MGGQAMTEYRIVEQYRRFHIQVSHERQNWRDLSAIPHVPRFFDTLADARSWVATIRRGVVYHDVEAPRVYNDAEDAPITVTTMWERYSIRDTSNLAQDERKAEDDTSNGIKPLEWFLGRVGKVIMNDMGYHVVIIDRKHAEGLYHVQEEGFYRYSDTPTHVEHNPQ